MKKLIIAVTIMIVSLIGIFGIIDNVRSEHNYYEMINTDILEEKKNNNERLIVYYFKKNCGACSKFKPTLNSVIKNLGIEVFAIDVENEDNDYYEIIRTLEIKVSPTVVIYENGLELRRQEGAVAESEFRDFINNTVE